MFGGQLFDTIVKILVTLAIATILVAILPVSPFQGFIEDLETLPYIGYLNWLFPVGKCLSVLSAWAVCLGAYYAIAWILRQLNILGQ